MVAEEVAEADGARANPAEHLREGRLVDFEEPELGVVGGEERGGHAGDEIRAGVVVRQPKPRPKDLGRHRRGRGLPVRRRDHSCAGGQPGRQAVDRAGVELRQELPRHRHAGARADEARQRGDTARGTNLDGQTHAASVCDERGNSIE